MACIAHTLAALGADHTLAADPDVLRHLQDTAHRMLRATGSPKAVTRNGTDILQENLFSKFSTAENAD